MNSGSSESDNKPNQALVIVFDNGSISAYEKVHQALCNAHIDCILIQGQTGPSPDENQLLRLQSANLRDQSIIEYSTIIPIFNEADNIPELYRRLTMVMKGLKEPYELIFINDGSRDQSLDLLEELYKKDSSVRVVNLARNFGHQKAISAGLDFARGQAIIVMDGDLQDPPEVIPQFIAKWRENFQVVYAVREKRKENIFKRTLYHLFYLILHAISKIDIPLDSGDFCLMDRCVVNIITSLPERNRFIRGLRSWSGYRQVGLAYEREARFAGKSKYSFKKLVNLALDGLISFSFLPLRFATLLGFVVSVFSLLAAIYYIWVKLTVGLQPPGFATLTVLLLFLGGVQLVTIGIIGEYIGHILNEVKGRPTYIVQQVFEHPNIGGNQ